jgi:peroxiredoxin
MDDFKNVFDKIEKAESILKELEKKQEDEALEKNTAPKLSKEHQSTIDSARQTIASIKDKLSKELAARTLELDKCQEELVLLQTRLKVGEITEDVFQTKSKHLIEKIKSLEKKVIDTQNLINAKFAEDVAPIIESGKPASTPLPGPLEQKEAKPAEAVAAQPEIPEVAKAIEEVQPGPEQVEIKAAEQETAPPVDENKTVEVIAIPPQSEAAEVASPAAPAKDEAPPAEEKIELKENDKKAAGEPKIKESEKGPVTIKQHKPSFHLHPLNERSHKKESAFKSDMLRKNRALWVVTAAIIVGLLLISAVMFLVPRTGSSVGNLAPDFVMQLSSDNTSSISALRGKNVVLVFWDRDFWDSQFFYVNGVARKLYTPDKLNQIYEKTPRSELAVIAIASGTNNNEIDKLIKDYGVKFPVIVDSFGKLRAGYNITEEPTYIFIDKSGVIRARVEGPLVNMSSIEQIVYAISKHTEVKPVKPPITDVLVQAATEKSAVINWSTSVPTTTQVDIDGKNIQTIIAAPTTLHSLTLRDLEPAASYHVRILYNVDNINVSEHSFSALNDTIVSKRYQMATSNKDTSYPEISNISTGFITDSSLTITWKTDESTTGNIDYSVDKSYKDTATQGNNMTIWHTVKVDGLKPDTLYSLKLRSKDASGKEAMQEIEPVKTLSLIETAPVLGKRAPNFTLYSLDGTKFTLSQFQGRPVLLNFWLEGCPACEAEMPLLQTAFNKYNRDELIILAVNVRGDHDKVSFYVGSQKLTFPILMDAQGDVDGVYRAPYFPTSYFIDSKGIIRQIKAERFQTISEIDDILSKIE